MIVFDKMVTRFYDVLLFSFTIALCVFYLPLMGNSLDQASFKGCQGIGECEHGFSRVQGPDHLGELCSPWCLGNPLLLIIIAGVRLGVLLLKCIGWCHFPDHSIWVIKKVPTVILFHREKIKKNCIINITSFLPQDNYRDCNEPASGRLRFTWRHWFPKSQIIFYCGQGELGGGRNRRYHKIGVTDTSWSEQNTEHGYFI